MNCLFFILVAVVFSSLILVFNFTDNKRNLLLKKPYRYIIYLIIGMLIYFFIGADENPDKLESFHQIAPIAILVIVVLLMIIRVIIEKKKRDQDDG